MKRNLLSIIILALLIVNIVLTSIMMFSVTSTSKKTAALVNDIASVLNLELEAETSGEDVAVEVAMEDMAVYEISEKLTIPCKKGEDGADHYYITNVSLSMNMKDEGYKKFSETLVEKESIIESEIFEVFSNHTLDEVLADTDAIKAEILTRIQDMFASEFIYKVSFSNTLHQ